MDILFSAVAAAATTMWSPDDSMVAICIVREDKNKTLLRVSRRLPAAGVEDFDHELPGLANRFVWMADSRHIVVMNEGGYLTTHDVINNGTVMVSASTLGLNGISNVRVSRDGKQVSVHCYKNSKIHVYDWNGSLSCFITSVPIKYDAVECAWSLDSKYLLTTLTGTLEVWNGNQRIATQEGVEDFATNITWSPDRNKYALADAHGYRVHQIIDQSIQFWLPSPAALGPSVIQWSPNGKQIAASHKARDSRFGLQGKPTHVTQIVVWETEGGRVVHDIYLDYWIYFDRLMWSADSKKLYAYSTENSCILAIWFGHDGLSPKMWMTTDHVFIGIDHVRDTLVAMVDNLFFRVRRPLSAARKSDGSILPRFRQRILTVEDNNLKRAGYFASKIEFRELSHDGSTLAIAREADRELQLLPTSDWCDREHWAFRGRVFRSRVTATAIGCARISTQLMLGIVRAIADRALEMRRGK